MPNDAKPSILRPTKGGVGAALVQWALSHMGIVFCLLRRWWPIAHFGRTYLITRADDVREILQSDADFPVPYKPKLDIIMGGEPFFLGMGDTPAYRSDTDAMRHAMRRADVATRLGPAAEQNAAQIVAEAQGRLEVVGTLARTVTFDVLCNYFGVPKPAEGDLRVWATRLFEFQFADGSNDPALRCEVDGMAPALRRHIDQEITVRRQSQERIDDVLGRCLDYQAQGRPGFSDVQIRSALIGFVVGGLPQPPMVIPQVLEQLMQRPRELAAAHAAARNGDDALLARYVFEALRFDPLAPALQRKVARDHVVAAGTKRATLISEGSQVLVAFSSAMMDERRVADPRRFCVQRPDCDYIHFGHALHTCFGIHINRTLIPLILKPLLAQPGLRRADGQAGRLVKKGAFSSSLWVEYRT